MFYRLSTDGTRQPVTLTNLFAGPTRSACWIIGGGPFLATLPIDLIERSSIPKFNINLAGHGLIRPDFWTSYDPTVRFLKSTYLDASILKFVHRCRAMDLIPETTFKVCDAPGTLFFDRDKHRGFADFLRPATPNLTVESGLTGGRDAIPDWQDSLIQAVAIACELGFRQLYLAGCEMCIPPSHEQLQVAATHGVTYLPREPLRDFVRRCRDAGLSEHAFSQLVSSPQYHFDETKPLAAAINTDLHYFRVAQYLRLCQRNLATAGVTLISTTPQSRLNDAFAYQSVESVVAESHRLYGDPQHETTRGRYTSNELRVPAGTGPMRDFPPHTGAARAPPSQPSPPLSDHSRLSGRPNPETTSIPVGR